MSTDMTTKLESVPDTIDIVQDFFGMIALVAEHPHLGFHLADTVRGMTDQELTLLIRFGETAATFAITEQQMRKKN